MQSMGPMMQQMLGPQANMNQSLRQMAEGAGGQVGEEDQSIVLKLMEELSMQECMSIYMGNFSAV